MALKHTLNILINHPLNRHRRINSIYKFITWQVVARLNKDRTHTFDWISGAKFTARKGETGITGNIYAGLHEFTDMAFLLHYLREEDLFFDIGANVGSYTILAGAVVGAKVVSMEPVPSTHSRLNENITINRIENVVNAKLLCVGDKEGVLKFTTERDTTNHVIADGEVCGNSISVDVVTLDSLSKDRVPDLIKIDVEGFEVNVIEGGSQTLADPTLNAVIMEVNGSGSRYGISNTKILDRMFSYGFKPYIYDPFSRKLSPASEDDCNSGNVICIRDLAAVIERLNSSISYEIFGRTF